MTDKPEQLGAWNRQEHEDIVSHRIKRSTQCDDLHATYAAQMAWSMVAEHVAKDGDRLAHPAHEQAEFQANAWAYRAAQGVTGLELERLEHDCRDRFARAMNDTQLRASWLEHLDRIASEGPPQPITDPELIAEQMAIERAETMGIAQHEGVDSDDRSLEDALAGGDVQEVWEHLEEAFGNVSMRDAREMLTRYQAENDKAVFQQACFDEWPDEESTPPAVVEDTAAEVWRIRSKFVEAHPSTPRAALNRAAHVIVDRFLSDIAEGVTPQELRASWDGMAERFANEMAEQDNSRLQIAPYAAEAIRQLAAMLPDAERQSLHREPTDAERERPDYMEAFGEIVGSIEWPKGVDGQEPLQREPTEADVTRHMMTGEDPTSPRGQDRARELLPDTGNDGPPRTPAPAGAALSVPSFTTDDLRAVAAGRFAPKDQAAKDRAAEVAERRREGGRDRLRDWDRER